jgi:hypothetical protein
MNKKYTFEEAMEAYRLRSELGKKMLRGIASMRLVRRGAEEVGTSDINHELCAMYNEYNGDYDECYLEELDQYRD